MSAMTFSDDMARIQRAVAQCRDIVLRYSQVLEALQLRRGERVLEIGCGGGFLTSEVAQCVGPTGEVRAIDISADQIAAAQNRCAELSWATCEVADAISLPYEDGTFDLVYGHQVFDTSRRWRRPSAKSNAYCALAGAAPSWPRTGTRQCGILSTWNGCSGS